MTCVPRRPAARSFALALACLAPLATAAAADDARAFGPGVHSREAQVVLARLAAADPDHAALAATPLATSWLSLGAISPDFMFMADALGFGHEPGLSAHLRAAAAELAPEYRLFALGHTCHVASDGASEAFVVPTLFSSAAVGATDLFAGQPAYKEAEGVVESLGDLLTGDWDAIVDLLYDLWLPLDQRARFDAVFAWYCTTGAAFLGRTVDCAAARAEVGATLGRAEGLFAAFDREGAHTFIHEMTGLPVPDLVTLALDFVEGSGLGGLVGGALGTGPSDAADAEIAFLMTTPFADRAFWAGYDDLADLGPSFAIDRIADGTSGWPHYDIPGIESGLLSSYLQFLPDEFDVTPGLIVDDLVYRDPDGAPITSVDAALAGATLTATLRLYSAHPLDATLHARVRKARPGLASASDPIVGAAALDLAIDPTTYARTPRATLVVPFTADLEGALAFDVELALGDARPTWTTSRDRLWTSPALDLAAPSFQEILTTFPRALPVAAPAVDPSGMALVEVVVAPDGPGLAGANVALDETHTAATTERGFAVFDGLTPGPYLLDVGAPGFAPADAISLDVPDARVAPGRSRVALHAIPVVVAGDAGWTSTPDAIAITIDPAPFAGQATDFLVSAYVDDPIAAVASGVVPASGQGTIAYQQPVADGVELIVTATASYAEGTGVEGVAHVRVDRSPPTIAATFVPTTAPSCLDEGPAMWIPDGTLTVAADDPHSGVAALAWRTDGDWIALTGPSAAVPAGEGAIVVRATSGAGRSDTVLVARPEPIVVPACVAEPEPAPEPTPEPSGDPGAELDTAAPRAGADAGCTLGPPPLWLAGLFLLARGWPRGRCARGTKRAKFQPGGRHARP